MSPDARRAARPLTPEEIAQQAAVTLEDIERAKVAAEREGSALLNRMLNAEEEG